MGEWTMKRVTRYVCDECGKEHGSPGLAEFCETTCRKINQIRTEHDTERKKWEDQGHAIWYENAGMMHAPLVDTETYGPHNYTGRGGTIDCAHGCGCWMGAARSGGPVDPFGACPKNPK